MARGAAWGMGKALGGREAARIAMERALGQMGTARPVAGIILAAQEFDLEEVVRSVTPMLSNVPLWGFSSTGVLTAQGEQPHAVVVMILSGSKLSAEVFSLSEDNKRIGALQTLQQALERLDSGAVLVAADGYSVFPDELTRVFDNQHLTVCGGLASGSHSKGKTFQIGGDQVVRGGSSALVLGGRFRAACGMGSGWISTGKTYQVTRAENIWIDELDGRTPAEVYAEAFGCSARDWAFPPLSELLRLYPLGGVIAEEDNDSVTIHAPLWMEVDGRLRINLPTEEGERVDLLVGDRHSCLQAAAQAAQEALLHLGKAQPIAALVFMDAAWQMLFEDQTSLIMQAIQAVIPEVPLLGAYTLGQILKINPEDFCTFHNQQIEVVLLATVIN